MNTIDLYVKVLKDVRFKVLSCDGLSLNDFSDNDKAYDLLCQVNAACNTLSNLISIMEYEASK